MLNAPKIAARLQQTARLIKNIFAKRTQFSRRKPMLANTPSKLKAAARHQTVAQKKLIFAKRT